MTHDGNESRSEKGSFHEASVTDRQRAVIWILVAFVFLIVGLAGGTAAFAWRREWAWLIPVAGFGGYLLAFSRGMLLWNPAVDRAWRRHLILDGGFIAEGEQVSPKTPRPARCELRLVR